MAEVETLTIERMPARNGERRAPFRVRLWQGPEGWRWNVLHDEAAFSDPFPTRDEALRAAVLEDGLGPY